MPIEKYQRVWYLKEEDIRVLRGKLLVMRGHHLAGAAPCRREVYLQHKSRVHTVSPKEKTFRFLFHIKILETESPIEP